MLKTVVAAFLFAASLVVRVEALYAPPILNGPVGPDLRIVAVPRTKAFNHIKKCQVEQLGQNAPAHICGELDVARELLRDPSKKDYRAAFLAPHLSNQILFTIVYRVRERRPNVYTPRLLSESQATMCAQTTCRTSCASWWPTTWVSCNRTH